jgi:hypothetical protein
LQWQLIKELLLLAYDKACGIGQSGSGIELVRSAEEPMAYRYNSASEIYSRIHGYNSDRICYRSATQYSVIFGDNSTLHISLLGNSVPLEVSTNSCQRLTRGFLPGSFVVSLVPRVVDATLQQGSRCIKLNLPGDGTPYQPVLLTAIRYWL